MAALLRRPVAGRAGDREFGDTFSDTLVDTGTVTNAVPKEDRALEGAAVASDVTHAGLRIFDDPEVRLIVARADGATAHAACASSATRTPGPSGPATYADPRPRVGGNCGRARVGTPCDANP